ncbi:MAG TPA: protein kinase [Polyangiales bacterium]|nr:protein kinase [Polyangiales bacterium]
MDPTPAIIGSRYKVLQQLGRGGSAHVYHVREISSERELALKRLRHDLHATRIPELTKRLEYEFYALAQLRHPRVIEVYDYGVSDGLPYYTMELLDGGDLRASAPLPARRACELIYDIASSLALLHSRRFVHRDVTPSNIRCTRDGRAKLIDFGAMVPMGIGANAIGTPAYVAPEVRQRGVLDACTDLFSLGATLYFTLTGRVPFAALDLASMPAAWAVPPLPPSHHVPEIPAGLDALVLSLISIEPAHRPRSAFEVMQRLAALAGLHVNEAASVAQGYLSAPHVVGRDNILRTVRNHLQRALLGAGSALWIDGDPGVGRSRLLELCTLEAKTSGACVLGLDASDGGAAFAGAERLTQEALATLPELARDAPPPSDPEALIRWFLALCARQPIVIAIDDLQSLDQPSLAWLAGLAHAASRAKLLLLMSVDSAASHDGHAALGVLQRHSMRCSVQPLSRTESDAMFASVFGSVPNLALVGERIYALSAGNPRRSLALAQHLVDQGHIVYAAGAWSLPDDLPAEALAIDVDALFGARLSRLGTLARTLAELQALSLVSLRRADYRVLVPDADERALDDALTELIAHEVVRSDGVHYVLSQRGYAAALQAQVEPLALAQRHAALAQLAEQQQRHAYVVAYHHLHAGQQVPALALLAGASETPLTHLSELDHKSVRSMLERALQVSLELERPKRERFELMRQMTTLSLLGHADLYWRVGPVFRHQLQADANPATPADERVFRVDEALRLLALYVGTSIAIGARTTDIELLSGLLPLLEPFVASSPLLLAIRENVEATCDSVYRARLERACACWQRVFERLEAMTDDPRLAPIRAAVAYGLGQCTATLGLAAEATHWIERLDREPLQRVNAMRVRRILCLQHGDWAGAERAREQAELMSLQASSRQIFEGPLRIELHAHWLARDLAGVKQTAERIGRLVLEYPGWSPHHLLAQGYFEALRGDAPRALRLFDECISVSQPDPSGAERNHGAWLSASAASLSMLLDLGSVDEARARGESVLAQCGPLSISVAAQPVACELALAEARSGAAAQAIERLENVIADQRQRGVSGLQLGATYEARARVALALHDEAAAARYAALAAREYRHGPGSILTARYGQLLQEARRAGVRMPAQASEITEEVSDDPVSRDVARALGEAHGDARAALALQLLCERGRNEEGHLYLARGADSELAWVASSMGPPSEPVARFARGFWRQQLEEAEMSAVLTEASRSQEMYAPASWKDPQGECYEAVVLYDARALPRLVGLAVLRVGERREKPELHTRMLSALALQLAAERLAR